MRFGIIDVLFASTCFVIGAVLGLRLSLQFHTNLRLLAALLGGAGMYLVLIYPFYRCLRLFPMILPRCPCCQSFQQGFHILDGQWPRNRFRCPQCQGEFVIWHNGKPSHQETWETPVLALKWPYAFGIYRKMTKPGPSPASESNSAPK